MTDLVSTLERHADALARRPIDEMYASDPFWERRFGARGRRYADQDGNHHVTYLVESLRERDPARLERYALWLRSVLVSRGMCTRHVLENLARLDAAIGLLALGDGHRASRHLQAAQAALSYGAAPAGRLQALSESLADDALAALEAYLPAPRTPADLPDARRELVDLVWFLADALAADRDAIFATHAGWLAENARDRGAGEAYGDALLGALGTALERRVAAAARDADARACEQALPLVERTRRALGEPTA